MVFLSNIFDDELPIRGEMISTGAAFGTSENNMALETGFLEIVERDCALTAYLTKKDVPKITNLPEDSERIIDYAQRYYLESHVFDVGNDLEVPSTLSVTIDRSGIGPAVCVGASSRFKYEDSIRESLLETLQWRGISRLIKDFHIGENLPKEHEINSMNNRFFYWYSKERIKDIEFLTNKQESVNYNDLKKYDTNFENSVYRLSSMGYHIFSADMTLPEQKNEGFEAKKLVIPELQPLYLDENAKMLYSKHHGKIKEAKGIKPHPIA